MAYEMEYERMIRVTKTLIKDGSLIGVKEIEPDKSSLIKRLLDYGENTAVTIDKKDGSRNRYEKVDGTE